MINCLTSFLIILAENDRMLIDQGECDLVHDGFLWQTSPDEKKSNIDITIEILNGYF